MQHSDRFYWDNHVYLPEHPGSSAIDGLERHREAGFGAVMLNVGDADAGLEFVIRMIAHVRSWIDRNHDRFLLIENVSDIGRARLDGKLAVGLNLEGLFAIGEQIEMLSLLRDLGLRWALFVYNRRNLMGCGVHDPVDDGLTQLGRKAVIEMDRLGIIKCLSHTGHRTVYDILSHSSRPCMFSHSNSAALWPHPRNIPDALIRACAQTGGVIGINGIASFLGDGPASAERMADHIDHVAQVAGIEHVAIGTDYGYEAAGEAPSRYPGAPLLSDFWPSAQGYAVKHEPSSLGPEQIAKVFENLLDRGYSAGDLDLVASGNMLRLAEAVWGPGDTPNQLS